jgi:hypothetical protein
MKDAYHRFQCNILTKGSWKITSVVVAGLLAYLGVSLSLLMELVLREGPGSVLKSIRPIFENPGIFISFFSEIPWIGVAMGILILVGLIWVFISASTRKNLYYLQYEVREFLEKHPEYEKKIRSLCLNCSYGRRHQLLFEAYEEASEEWGIKEGIQKLKERIERFKEKSESKIVRS